MFVCNECLKTHYLNGESLAKSYGPCEICGNTKTCNDIPSKYLKPKN